ncbi:FadR/GntR family transcriptional regulator [Paenactinomyces guangxiensis]|uniref:FadR family transcriptional regulator n=1 Tax=Paenactinomyces guangxiensis TaxID=1490290 RepID=A0A7W1WSJ3_9BACL|nr:FCD domain-containing protein [Paenactinomyces guangxiensis]MBA4495280.1 FadR family transcriptional regulator [Paenactinomyces guangxiensis]MBH8592364.1 FadR family transcriptional regulator [Paenactinomyces guangxiensis]
MVSDTGSSKFATILKRINQLIEADGLGPGDRLPSERELSERLQAGRSSIREVLRSLELLGLIRTRRGEGTFLEPYHSHHLVDLLAGYILRDLKSRQDLAEMRALLEMGAVRLAVKRAKKKDVDELEKKVVRMKQLVEQEKDPGAEMKAFHERIIKMADNYLLTRTWYPIVHYGETLGITEHLNKCIMLEKALQYYLEIIHAVKHRHEQQAVSLMERIWQYVQAKQEE